MKHLSLLITLLLISSFSYAQQSESSTGVLVKKTIALRDYVPVDESKLVQVFGKDGKRIWPEGTVRPGDMPVDEVLKNFLPKDYLDPVVQKNIPKDVSYGLAESYGIISGIEGMFSGGYPLDPTICVGPNHVIQLVNNVPSTKMKIWNKDGTVAVNEVILQSITGFPGYGDAIALYDQFSDRYIITEFIIKGSNSAAYNGLSVMVSATNDPTGAWYSYKWTISENYTLDYPKWAVWSDGIYVHTNNFPNGGGSYVNSYFAVMNKEDMYNGNASFRAIRATQSIGDGYRTCPAQLEGNITPSGGQLFITNDDGTDQATVISCTTNWTNLTLTQSTAATINLAPFNQNTCQYWGENCAPQSGGPSVDMLSGRIMNQPIYRVLPDYNGLVFCFTVNAGGTKPGIRWVELKNTGSGWTKNQESTWSPNTNYQFMPSIAYDKNGNIGLAYNSTSASSYIGIRYTGRKACDPLGQMTLPEATLMAGTGASNSDRWGDYGHMVADPDGNSLWMVSMYGRSGATGGRGSYISRFDIEPCVTGACNAPTNLTASSLTTTSATANFIAPGGANTFDLDYKVYTSNTWINAATNTTSTALNLTGLTAGTLYDWRVRSNCSGNSSAFATAQFTTPSNNCGTVSGLTATSVTGTTATINWSALSGANNYTVEYKINTAPTWTTAASSTTALTLNLSGLSLSTLYDWRVKANCTGASGDYSSSQFTTTATASTLFNFGASWKYLDNGTNQGTAWYASSFSDASWASGNGELGYGDGDESTVVGYGGNSNNKYITTYFRKTISIADPAAYSAFAAKVKRDDGLVVYLNGTEVYRSNMGSGSVTYTTLASLASDDGVTAQSFTIAPSAFVSGNNVFAVEVHQNAASSSDLTFDMELTGTLVPNTCGPLAGLTASSLSASGAIVSWTALNGALNYDVDYKINTASVWTNASTATTATIISLTGLAAGTLYDWRVRAHCTGTTGAYYSAQFTTTAAASCGAVTSLSSSNITTSEALVSWQAVSGALNYDVDFKANASSTWTNAATATTSLTQVLSGLTTGTVYDWRIRANCLGATGAYSSGQFSTNSSGACGAATGLSTSSITTTGATLSWTALAGASNYDVDYKISSSSIWTNAATATTATSINVAGLSQGSLYDWRIRANCSGGSGVYSGTQFATTTSSQTPDFAYGASWKYLDNGTNQGTAWRAGSFNDAAWASGNAELGYGDYDETTVVGYGNNASNKYVTTYFRKTINVGDPASFSNFTAYVKRDDGIVVYLNGNEVYRNNMGTGSVAYNTLASLASDDGLTAYSFTIAPAAFVGGNNVFAVEIHQTDVTSSDISFDMKLVSTQIPGSCGTVAGLTASGMTTSGATLNWSALVGASNYDVDYKANSSSIWINAASGTTITTVNVSGLAASTLYDWRVRAHCSGVAGAYASTQFTSATPNPTPDFAYGASWKYLDDGTNQGTGWTASSFNDASWASGNGQLGYGDYDEATELDYGSDPNNKYVTTYFRKTVNFNNPSGFSTITAKVKRDDGMVVYVNGTEVFRDLMGTGSVTYTTLADLAYDDGETPVVFTISPGAFVAGSNVIAVEIHQTEVYSSDISFDMELVSTANSGSCGTVTGLSASAITANNVTLGWAALGGANSYDVDYKINASSTWTNAVTSTTSTSYSLTGLTAGTLYDWRVRAKCTGVNGAYASTQFATATAGLIPDFQYGSSWKYLDNGSNQGTAWTALAYNDASWGSGNGQLGYGDYDETTLLGYGSNADNKFVTTYFRKTINILNPSNFSTFTAHVKRDDGIVVFVNGTEVYRNNMPTGTITYSTLASLAYDDGETTQIFTISPGAFTSGNNVIAVEIHQTELYSTDISFDMELIGTPISGLCGTVSGLTAAAITTTGATLSWSALSGAINYDVDYKSNTAATWINAGTATSMTSVSLSGLTTGIVYDWRVRANCSSGPGAYSNTQFTTASGGTCGSVTGLATSSITTTSATISWSAVSSADSYDVDYKTSASASWINLATASTAQYANLADLVAGTLYDWRVRANCPTSSGAYTNTQFATATIATCGSVTGMSVGPITNTGATLSWALLSGANNYDVDYKTNATATWINAVTATTLNSVALTNLTQNTVYDWRIRANCTSGPGAYATAQFTTASTSICGAVSGLNSGSITTSSATISWSALLNANNYDVSYKLNTASTWTTAATATTALFVNLNGLTASSLYDWRVRANCTSGSGAYVQAQFSTSAGTNATLTRGPYLNKALQTGIVIRWRTNVATNSKVDFGTSPGSLSQSVTDNTVTTEHIVTLTGLSSNTLYYYNIGSSTQVLQGDAGNYFKTMPVLGSTQKIRFLAMGDMGVNSSAQVNVRNAWQTFNGSNYTDGWLLLGDNAYNNGTDAEYQSNFYNIYQGSLTRNHVLWPSVGNHDYANSSSRQADHAIPYYDMFSLPMNGEAGGVASNNEAYYSYDYANVHFVSLDSYGWETGSTRLYDTLGPQAVWLKQDLAANTQPWTVVYFHHPPYTKGSHDSDSETELINMRQKIVPILERYHVDLVLNGHSHSYERSYLIQGHYGTETSFNLANHALSSSSAKYDGSVNSCTYIKNASDVRNGIVYAIVGTAGQIGGTSAGYPHNAMYYSNVSNYGALYLEVENNRLSAKWVGSDGVIRDNFNIMKEVNKTNNITIASGASVTLTASWIGSYSWSNGATTSSITVNPTSNTTYSVSDGMGCITDLFNVTVTLPFQGGSNVPQFETVSGMLSPNPVSSILTVNLFGMTAAVNIRVMDLNGRVVLRKLSSENETALDVSKLHNGFYLITITDEFGKQLFSSKFIKE